MSIQSEKILILPAAGENLPNLGGIILALKEIGYRPTTIGCTSCGSIIGALICSSGIENTFQTFIRNFLSKFYDLSSKNYLRAEKLSLRSLSNSFKFGTYSPGIDPPLSLIDFEFLHQPRLVIGVHNIQNDQTELFTTKALKGMKSIETISDLLSVLRASMTLPGILSEYKIGENTYLDDSINGPSIYPRLSELYEKSINIVYVCPYDIKFPMQLFPRQEIGINTIPGYRSSKYSSEIENLISELNRFPGPIQENSGNTIYELGIALDQASNSIANIILLFPRGLHSISYSSAEKGEISRKINLSYDDGFTFKQYFKY